MAMAYPLIIELAKKSGIPYRVTSTYRPGDPLNHGKGQAVDFGGESQDKLAQYFQQFDTLEVIHKSKSTGRTYGSSRNVAYAPGSNAGLLAEHMDHVHIAMTYEQATKALGGAIRTSGGGSSGGSPAGGVITAFAGVARFFLDQENRRRIVYVMAGIVLVFYGIFFLGDKPAKYAQKAFNAAGPLGKRVGKAMGSQLKTAGVDTTAGGQ